LGLIVFNTESKKLNIWTGTSWQELPASCPSGSNWTRKADFPGTRPRYGAIGFSIGQKGYVGLGSYYNVNENKTYYLNDFWEYDPVSNTWSQKANYPGGGRINATGFSIGQKGYVGMGQDYWGHYFSDFYEYNPLTNSWFQKANIPGNGRRQAVGFSIGSKGYVGTGYYFNYPNPIYLNDFWEYDPSTNTWSKKADVPTPYHGCTGRGLAIGFAIGQKGYIGTGTCFDNWSRHSRRMSDFWEYDPLRNIWTRKANFEGMERDSAVGFSIGQKGYVGTGNICCGACGYWINDWWEYDPLSDAWVQKTNFPSLHKGTSVGFSINQKGYVLTPDGELWEYNP
jgi:N-acetylneuraminic acid mutarotase